jgi:phage/plasmid-associated DNA primase
MKKTISMFAASGCSDEKLIQRTGWWRGRQGREEGQKKRVLDSEDCGTKDKILKECAELFYHENFEQTLDEKTHLMGFNNGIFDLNKNQFREGVPNPSVHVYGHRL